MPQRDDRPELKVSEIWFGRSVDGLLFEMDPFPSIFPGPDQIDLDGCEDPTVVAGGDGLHVVYTGYNAGEETGRLVVASDMGSGVFRKEGVLIDSAAPFINPKEAAFAHGGGSWTMFFEYAGQTTNLSMIDMAVSNTIAGPWRTLPDRVLSRREGCWDSGHMSPGIILYGNGDAPILFYNGDDDTDGWRIGWAVLDRTSTRVVARCTSR